MLDGLQILYDYIKFFLLNFTPCTYFPSIFPSHLLGHTTDAKHYYRQEITRFYAFLLAIVM
jgi:hypothetical protein